MPTIATCPECGLAGHFLAQASKESDRDYYKCETCWHVWAVERGTLDENKPSDGRDRTESDRDQ